MLLFISHASEDQADFVKPLADELSKVYEVWYAPYRLSLGDSLLQKISEGLVSCDFGVVVLSHAFFGKKWTKAELDGLFALEGTSRKIILPVRKGLTPEEVTQYSPILGSKLSVSADEGLSKVVEEIRLAVDVSERKRQLTIVERSTQKLKLLEQSLREKRESETLLCKEDGVILIRMALTELYDIIEKSLRDSTSESTVMGFQFSRPIENVFRIVGPFRIEVHFGVFGMSPNHAANSVLCIRLIIGASLVFGTEREDVENIKFKPAFRAAKKVFWVSDSLEDQSFGVEELAGYVLELLMKEIEIRSQEASLL